MNMENEPQKNDDHLMDGGFAVVDRERLIAEETKEITPWYKNLMNLFVAPKKTMNETILADPVKGTALGFFSAAFLGIIYMIIYYMNPVVKMTIYDTLRAAGISEERLATQMKITTVSSCIGILVGVLLASLIVTVLLQIIRAIAKDKGSFKQLFIISLLSQVVTYAVLVVDGILQSLLGTSTTVLGLGALFSAETLTQNIALQTLVSEFSVGNIWGVIILIIGYKAMSQKSTKKSVIVVLIYELITVFYTYGMLALSQAATQMLNQM